MSALLRLSPSNPPPDDNPPVPRERNVCSGPFGALYDYYIERPWLARLVLGAMWGVDPRPFYRSLHHLAELPDDATVLDVPCGGGVALRELRPGQRVRWLAVDIEPAMLARTKRCAALHPDADVQLIEGDMYRLELPDATADLCLSYGGLHCLARPEDALAEMARCLLPDGRLLGSTFLAHGSRRQRLLLRNENFGNTGSADDLRNWAERRAAGVNVSDLFSCHANASFGRRRTATVCSEGHAQQRAGTC